MTESSVFDVVILGGGTAGCVAANSLSRSGLRVCLVEAGPDYGPYKSGKWPAEVLNGKVAPVTTHDWGYHSLCYHGREMQDLRARIIGGCSAHNHCTALWPPHEDFDSWGSGWSYDELLPLIDQVEAVEADSFTPFRGRNGLLTTRILRDADMSAWQRLFAKAVGESGYPWSPDLGASLPGEGLSFRHCNIRGDYVRWNTAFAFLDSVRDLPNLTILSETLIDRLVMKGSRAVEVLCRSRGQALSIRSSAFILTGGVYGSPPILMRSGIGPRKELESLGIEVAIDLPGVGKNLQDHPGIVIKFAPSQIGKQMIKEHIEESKSFIPPVMLRVKSRHTNKSYDLHIIPEGGPVESGERAFGTFIVNMSPRSKGQVFLMGKDPDLPPRIDHRFFTDTNDLSVLADGIQIARSIWGSQSMRSLVEKELLPGAEANQPEKINEYIMNNNITYNHPAGTCKMGEASDPDSVVDLSGLVRGSENVYVADASIIPVIPRVNINLTCMLIGLKVANDFLVRKRGS